MTIGLRRLLLLVDSLVRRSMSEVQEEEFDAEIEGNLDQLKADRRREAIVDAFGPEFIVQ